jgi:5'-3' exoribonuclease 1
MGIPAYFSYIIRNHMKVLQKFNSQTHHIHNLYLDSNSIIYDSIRELEKAGKLSPVPSENFKTISATVCSKLQEYIDEIRPSNTVYIAFDGVAPFAKMKQQRTRRIRTAFMEYHGIIPKPLFSTIQITPGTDFMVFFSDYVNKHFAKKANIIVSAADKPGEGEHKLFKYIRDNPEKHISEHTLIYGLDADLLMLSIFHHEMSNLFVYRETPEFAKSLNADLENNAAYILDIKELCKSILVEMGTKDEGRIYDYAFLCFMLGNDFLPHLIALNLRTNGINHILTAYKETIGLSENHYIIKNKQIQWEQFNKVTRWMAKREEGWIRAEYIKRGEIRINMNADKETMFNNIPLIYREEEHYINPFEPKWEKRYYKIVGVEREKVKKEYMEGMEWVYRYYSEGRIREWKYKYKKGPLIVDVCVGGVGVGVGGKEEEEVDVKKQLEYVLVKEEEIKEKKFGWGFNRYMWEGYIDEGEPTWENQRGRTNGSPKPPPFKKQR